MTATATVSIEISIDVNQDKTLAFVKNAILEAAARRLKTIDPTDVIVGEVRIYDVHH